MFTKTQANKKPNNFSFKKPEQNERGRDKNHLASGPFIADYHYNLKTINLSGGKHLQANSHKIQPKLIVGQPIDKNELEADAMADRIMKIPGPSLNNLLAGNSRISHTLANRVSPMVQTKSKKEEEEDENIQTKRRAQIPKEIPSVSAHDIRSLGAGTPLPVSTRGFFESRFGINFGNVHIHNSPKASHLAGRLRAKAFTVGKDIIMGSGYYAPESVEGRHLLAHELTHTIQQRRGTGIQRKLEVGAGLSLDTKGYTHSKSGNVYTAPKVVRNIGLFNEVFTGLLGSPRVFKLKGTSNTEINKSFKEQRNARTGIANFAAKKKYTFAAGAGFKMNPKYWIVDASGWRLKPGVDALDAINDLNVNPTKYAIACLAATKLTMAGGGKSPTRRVSGATNDDWIPGDWGYIKNTKFSGLAKDVGLEGENIIYTGNDKFWGHFGPGNTYKTLTDWMKDVKSWNGGAALKDHRTFPTAGLD